MITRKGTDNDIILVSAEYWDDHPLSPVGVIARVLDAKGYRVGIIEKPEKPEDFTRLGAPGLFFGVTSGSVDSMLNNYTPMKRKREEDIHCIYNPMPDRAVIVYCNSLKRHFKEVPLVIGGIEASMRRFAHYDYWDNKLRRSILLDSRASVLVYGNGEKQVLEIAKRMRKGEPLDGVEGTCILSREADDSFEKLPSFKEVSSDKEAFCRMQAGFSNRKNLAQEYNNNYLLQYRYPNYTSEYLDWIYSLDYSRKLHPKSQLKMAQFSVITHRGCVGGCNFCSLSLHQADRVISRSEEGIIAEIRKLASHSQFRGVIDDLGGPSANMYGLDCGLDWPGARQDCPGSGRCLDCQILDRSHARLITLMEKARSVPGVKKVFVRSGIRYELALESPEYLEELSKHHISGCLKVAPEHFSPGVLRLMNKDGGDFDRFVSEFEKLNRKTGQSLRCYLMIGHPGDDLKELEQLTTRARELENIENFQLFTPTPMTASTCMYWTGRNPFTGEDVTVVYDYRTKKEMKRKMLKALEERTKRGGRPQERLHKQPINRKMPSHRTDGGRSGSGKRR